MLIVRPAFVFFALLLVPAMLPAQHLDNPQYETIAEGVTGLSPWFSVELSGGLVKQRLLRVYHHDNGGKTLIGMCRFSEHAGRENGYAISADGKTLLYFHQNTPEAYALNKPSGLYEYRQGEGDRQVHAFVNNSIYLGERLPANTLVFNRIIKEKDTLFTRGEVYLRDTEGNEKRIR